MNTLYILRGVSGSGKTTLAKQLEVSLGDDSKAIAADDFFYLIGNGEYQFDVRRLSEAHNWCKNTVKRLMENSFKNIILHNTNTQESEIQPYLDLAKQFNYKIVSLIVENRHGNSSVHDVPDEALKRQAARLKNSIKLN